MEELIDCHIEKLPADLIGKILSLLPTDSLFQARCVSKSWRAIINDPDYVKLPSPVMIISTPETFYKVDCAKNIHDDNFLTTIGLPVETEYVMNLVGSWKGFISVVIKDYDNGLTFMVWNPTSGHSYKTVAPIAIPPRPQRFEEYLAGFANDKILLIVSATDQQGRFETKTFVHSLSSYDWRLLELQTPSCVLHLPRATGLLLNNALHWRPSSSRNLIDPTQIIAFDIMQESYRSVPLPDSVKNNNSYSLCILFECLCISLNEQRTIKICMMKNYNDGDSWVNIFTIPVQYFPRLAGRHFRPFCMTKDGHFLGLVNNIVIQISLNSRERSMLARRICYSSSVCEAVEFLEEEQARCIEYEGED